MQSTENQRPCCSQYPVIPAKAGTQAFLLVWLSRRDNPGVSKHEKTWVPAFAGMIGNVFGSQAKSISALLNRRFASTAWRPRSLPMPELL